MISVIVLKHAHIVFGVGSALMRGWPRITVGLGVFVRGFEG